MVLLTVYGNIASSSGRVQVFTALGFHYSDGRWRGPRSGGSVGLMA
jgi:hypothetical protein